MHTDTSNEAARSQAEALRKLGPDRRFKIAWELSVALREIARRRLMTKHPEWSDAQIREALVWELHGIRISPH